jgi:hypothetical protein
MSQGRVFDLLALPRGRATDKGWFTNASRPSIVNLPPNSSPREFDGSY